MNFCQCKFVRVLVHVHVQSRRQVAKSVKVFSSSLDQVIVFKESFPPPQKYQKHSLTFLSGMGMLSCFIRVLQVMFFVSHHTCSYFVLAG